MTRARFVLGSDALRQRFDAVRQAVITAPRESEALRREIVAMRETVRTAHPLRQPQDGPPLFDIKHSPGGMVDAEFVVQYLVLSQAGVHTELLANVGNIALLERAERAGLLPPKVGVTAARAYRELRRMQHRARLDEQPTQVPLQVLDAEREAILRLWQAVFGQDSHTP